MMNTHVRMMAAGSSSGTTLAVNLTLTPAGKRVFTKHAQLLLRTTIFLNLLLLH